MPNTIYEEKAHDVLSLTYEQAVAALTKLGHDTPCHLCGCPDWLLASYNHHPNIVNFPVANAEGLAHWAFYIVCQKCGVSKLVDAAYVYAEYLASTGDNV